MIKESEILAYDSQQECEDRIAGMNINAAMLAAVLIVSLALWAGIWLGVAAAVSMFLS